MAVVQRTQAKVYFRRRPEAHLIYRTVQTYWPIFVREQARQGKILPHFIRDEFQEYLTCGIPEHGFVRTYCYECRFSAVIAFSCKRRGFCPSCTAKRMNIEAAHLVDQVLPSIPARQWVLSFPFKLRYQMAFDQKLTNFALKEMIQTITAFQRKRAKSHGVANPVVGAVTFIQRFGSALNLKSLAYESQRQRPNRQ